jgi:hypothetical protein
MILIAVAKVPDPRGNVRHLVTDVQGRITMSIEGALLKASAGLSEATLSPGRELSLPIKLARSPQLTEAVELDLVTPAGLQGMLRMDRAVVPPDRNEANLRINVAPDAKLPAEGTFTIRATAPRAGGTLPVVSEAVVPFVTAGEAKAP